MPTGLRRSQSVLRGSCIPPRRVSVKGAFVPCVQHERGFAYAPENGCAFPCAHPGPSRPRQRHAPCFLARSSRHGGRSGRVSRFCDAAFSGGDRPAATPRAGRSVSKGRAGSQGPAGPPTRRQSGHVFGGLAAGNLTSGGDGLNWEAKDIQHIAKSPSDESGCFATDL